MDVGFFMNLKYMPIITLLLMVDHPFVHLAFSGFYIMLCCIDINSWLVSVLLIVSSAFYALIVVLVNES